MKKEDAGCLCPYIKIYSFDYFPPVVSLREYADTVSEHTVFSVSDFTEDHMNLWHGFGPGYGGGPKP